MSQSAASRLDGMQGATFVNHSQLLKPLPALARLTQTQRARIFSFGFLALSSIVFLVSARNFRHPTPPSPAEIIAATNRIRASSGLDELSLNPKLQLAAMERASDMAAKKYFSHTSPDGVSAWDWLSVNDYSYEYAGENLAINYTDTQVLLEDWLASPSHKANLLNPEYNDIGVGVQSFEDHGKIYNVIVELYGTPKTLS